MASTRSRLISWIDEEAFLAMTSPQDAAETETSWYSDGWYDWCWHEDDWHAFVDGVYYTWGEMKPWLEVDEIAAVYSSWQRGQRSLRRV